MSRSSVRLTLVLAAAAVSATLITLFLSAHAAPEAVTIDLAEVGLGVPPAQFAFARTGEGPLGDWRMVSDPTSLMGIAIEHVSADTRDDRFPLAIYQPLRTENVALSIRFKIISGTMQTAGLAVCLRDPDSYYAIAASALEHRVDLLLFANGTSERIDSAEAEVRTNTWHTLGVTVNDDHFVVSLDGKRLLTTFDRTRMKDGRMALWTREDNVTRFEAIEIRPLPSPDFP